MQAKQFMAHMQKNIAIDHCKNAEGKVFLYCSVVWLEQILTPLHYLLSKYCSVAEIVQTAATLTTLMHASNFDCLKQAEGLIKAVGSHVMLKKNSGNIWDKIEMCLLETICH